MKRETVAFFALVASVAACGSSPPASSPRPDGGTDARADAASDSAHDAAPDAPPDRPPPPYDAGAPVTCDTAAFTRHVLDQSAGVSVLEAGGLVGVSGNFVIAVRQGATRITGLDGGPARRDTVDVMAVSSLGFPVTGVTTVYDSAATATDLSPPALVRAGSAAMVLFRESHGIQGQSDFSTRVRGALLDVNAARVGADITLEDRGDPFAATLPDGTVFVVAPRVLSRSDAGFVVATPNAVRIQASGMVPNPMGVDLSSTVPIEADSVMMRPTSTGAALVFRQLVDLRAVRFDGMGVVDTRIRVTRNVDATRLDDGAVLDEGVIVAWDEPEGTTHAIHVAVTDTEGALLANQVVERYDAPGSPVINVAAVHGGAAVLWIRGSGDTAMLRAMVMQPNGVVRAAPRDLLPVPGADGRMFSVGDGRALTFIARDHGAAGYGLTFGRLCLPE